MPLQDRGMDPGSTWYGNHRRPPTRIAELKAVASTAAGPGFKGGCPITMIAVVVGLQEDPEMKTTELIVKEYFNMLEEK